MAAVLCTACGEICNGAWEVTGKVCSIPCQLCGKACTGICDGCGNACLHMASLCTSPFSIFVVTAAVFNLPSIGIGLFQAPHMAECRGSQWLFVNALLCLINIAAAIYMAVVVVKASDEPTSQDLESGGRRPSTAFGRAGHLLCYDPIMALYIVILIGFFGWLWTGGIWSLNGRADNGCDGIDNVEGNLFMALGFGWAFIFFGIGALGCGMCCAYFGVGEGSSGSHTTSAMTTTYGTTDAASAQQSGLSTPFVNADTVPDKKASYSASGAAASAAPAAASATAASAKKEEIPTAQAVLF